VHADVYDEVVEQVVSSLAAVRTVDPLDEETEMGPVVSEDACNRITGIIERAQATGAGKLLLGGWRLGGELSGGYYFAPTVFGDVDPASVGQAGDIRSCAGDNRVQLRR
jgi:aldehyde dehydrogenase (NAD+)